MLARIRRMTGAVAGDGFWPVLAVIGLWTAAAASAAAQETVDSILGDPDAAEVERPEPLEVYMGRRIATTMHYTGAEWLIRDTRERQERCSLMLANLGIEPGQSVCDMGCGNGFYSLPLAKMVGADGQVLAVDIQPEMLSMLVDRSERFGLNNVTPILGSEYDPRLPPDSVDVMLLVDVYHEFAYPEHMLRAIRRSLTDEGVAVLVEFRAEDPNVPIRPLHKMSREQILREWPANGFKMVDEFDRLPWQHMMFFARDNDWVEPTSGDEPD